ncbi:hypothetical protein [Chitinimonas taiwanensis]|nr:hypothetical protein [Chitinimonas taiwanensis]
MKKLLPKGSAQFYLCFIASFVAFFYSKWETMLATHGLMPSLVGILISALLLLAVIGYWVIKNTDDNGELTIFKQHHKK